MRADIGHVIDLRCLYVRTCVSQSVNQSAASFSSFGQLLRNADKRIVNIVEI